MNITAARWRSAPRWLRRSVWGAGGLALAVALYGAAGYWLVPALARAPLERALGSALGGSARIERLAVRPFALAVSVQGATLRDGDGALWAGLARLEADAALASLWRRRIELTAVRVTAPWVEARITREGRLVLPLPAGGSEPSRAPPPVHVTAFELSDGRVQVEDRSRPRPLVLAAQALRAEGVALGTTGAGTLRLSGRLDGGGEFAAHGKLRLVPLVVAVQVSLSGLPVTRYRPYLPPDSAAALAGGTLALSVRVDYDAGELRLADGAARLTGLELVEPGGGPLVAVPLIEVSGSALSLTERRVQVGPVRARGIEVHLRRRADGSLNLAALAAPAAPGPASAVQPAPLPPAASGAATSPAPDTAAPPAPLPQAQDPPSAPPATPAASRGALSWRVEMQGLDLAAETITVADEAVTPAPRHTLGPVTLLAGPLRLGEGRSVAVELHAALAGGGTLAATGEVVPTPLAARLEASVADLPLALAQPYLAQRLHLELRGGTLGAAGTLAYGDAQAPLYRGAVTVSDFELWDPRRDEALVRWRRLTARALEVHAARTEVAELVLSAPYARFEIAPDGSTNVHGLTAGPPAGAAVPAPPPGEQAAASAPAAATADAGPAHEVRVGRVRVADGELDFADHTLTPHFAVAIKRLRGSVQNIATVPGSQARVALRGQVDGYAPAQVSGSVGRGAGGLEAAVTLAFRDIELSTFSPYAGKFAGYRVERGTLDLDLRYTVAGRTLTGQNRIVLDQLTLGERVESPDALDLPLTLAIALLKDGRGVIDLDLPVRGDLGNPQFDYRALIGKAIRRMLVKAVTAPFTFIGKLFTSGKPPRTVPFAPGDAALAERPRDDLARLAQVLGERPALALEIQGTAVADADGAALAAQALEAALAATPGEDEDERLLALYEEALEADADDLPVAEDAGDTRAARADAARAALLAHYAPDEAALRALARARAEAVRGILVAAGLEAARIRLVEAGILPAGERVRTRLKLTARQPGSAP